MLALNATNTSAHFWRVSSKKILLWEGIWLSIAGAGQERVRNLWPHANRALLGHQEVFLSSATERMNHRTTTDLDSQKCPRSVQAKNFLAGSRIRTDDLLITNQLLYPLSYAGIYEANRVSGKDSCCVFHGAILRSAL